MARPALMLGLPLLAERSLPRPVRQGPQAADAVGATDRVADQPAEGVVVHTQRAITTEGRGYRCAPSALLEQPQHPGVLRRVLGQPLGQVWILVVDWPAEPVGLPHGQPRLARAQLAFIPLVAARFALPEPVGDLVSPLLLGLRGEALTPPGATEQRQRQRGQLQRRAGRRAPQRVPRPALDADALVGRLALQHQKRGERRHQRVVQPQADDRAAALPAVRAQQLRSGSAGPTAWARRRTLCRPRHGPHSCWRRACRPACP